MFVSGPKEVQRLKAYPKRMSKYWILFRIPKRGTPLLGLPLNESQSRLSPLSTN